MTKLESEEICHKMLKETNLCQATSLKIGAIPKRDNVKNQIEGMTKTTKY